MYAGLDNRLERFGEYGAELLQTATLMMGLARSFYTERLNTGFAPPTDDFWILLHKNT